MVGVLNGLLFVNDQLFLKHLLEYLTCDAHDIFAKSYLQRT